MKHSRFFRAMVVALPLVVACVACSSTSGSTSSSSGGSSSGGGGSDASADAAKPTNDGGTGDGAADKDATPIQGCAAERAKKTSDCGADCDARLLLPAGDAYCTVQCEKDPDCDVHGTGLKCSTETGTCMPKCSTQAECTSAGFKRCDLTVGACDTI